MVRARVTGGCTGNYTLAPFAERLTRLAILVGVWNRVPADSRGALAERRQTVRRSVDRGGRRLRDPIVNLATHRHRTLSPAQLADWWGVAPETVLRWIHVGHPEYGHLPARHPPGSREWEVRKLAALAYEARLFGETRRVLPAPCAHCGCTCGAAAHSRHTAGRSPYIRPPIR